MDFFFNGSHLCDWVTIPTGIQPYPPSSFSAVTGYGSQWRCTDNRVNSDDMLDGHILPSGKLT